MTPPHLPPKASNIENHRLWQRLKLLLGVAVFSLVIGASGASIMLGWIWPRYAEGDSWIASYNRPALSKAQLEDRVRQEVSQRLVTIHRGSAVLGGANYLNKKIGDGVMLSSDGWLAMYMSEYDGNFKNILVALQDGSIYQAQNAVWDKFTSMLYIKIQNEQFKVVGFMDENDILDEVFVWQDTNWYHGTVLYPMFDHKTPHLDTAPIEQYSINTNFNSGAVAINSQGRIAGFISENKSLIPSAYITRMLSKVLSQQIVSYPSLGVEGWFSEEQAIFAVPESKTKAGEQLQGFLVSGVVTPGLLRKGDVLLEINGEIVSFDNLWYIISSNENVSVRILRNDKETELNIKVTQVK